MQAGGGIRLTKFAPAVAGLTCMFVECIMGKRPPVFAFCPGAVAGLVAIPPASGFVGPAGAMAIGVAAGVFCYWGATGLKHMFGYDDALDCFGVHAVGGIVGALLTGVFAVEQYGGTAGALYGNFQQLINQCYGVGTVIVYDAIASLIILKAVDTFIGLRVTDAAEHDVLGPALHCEVVPEIHTRA